MEPSTEVLSQIQKYLHNVLGREPSDAEILEMIDSLYYLGRAINRYLRLNKQIITYLLSPTAVGGRGSALSNTGRTLHICNK